MEGKNVTIVTVGSGKEWKYVGLLKSIKFTPLGEPKWFVIETSKSKVQINGHHIISISLYHDKND